MWISKQWTRCIQIIVLPAHPVSRGKCIFLTSLRTLPYLWQNGWDITTLKRIYRHFDDIFVMDPIGSCHCTTFGVASDNDFVKMIVFPFQCIYSEGKSWYTPISTAPEQHFNNTMMTSSNGNISRITGLLWGELTGHRWTPPPPPPPTTTTPPSHTHTKAIDGELWYFLWSAPE